MNGVENLIEKLEQSGVLTLGKRFDKIDCRLDTIERHIDGVKDKLTEGSIIISKLQTENENVEKILKDNHLRSTGIEKRVLVVETCSNRVKGSLVIITLVVLALITCILSWKVM